MQLFIYLAAPGLCCGMLDLVPWPRFEPGPPPPDLGVQILSHRTTREVPACTIFFKCSQSLGPKETVFLLTALLVHPVNYINHELIIYKHVCVCMPVLIFPCSPAGLEKNLQSTSKK